MLGYHKVALVAVAADIPDMHRPDSIHRLVYTLLLQLVHSAFDLGHMQHRIAWLSDPRQDVLAHWQDSSIL